MAGSTTLVESHPAPALEAVSFPVFVYTDSQPRDNLDTLDDACQQSVDDERMQWDSSRPRTADEPPTREPPAASTTFDFRLTAPPDEVIPSRYRPEDSPVGPHIIGVALGSPSMLTSDGDVPSPRLPTSIYATRTKQPEPPRSSKWKKIGGLFRAKNALAEPVNYSRTARPKNYTSKDNKRPARNPTKLSKRRESTEEWPKLPTERTSNERRPPGNFSVPGNAYLRTLDRSPLLEVNIPDGQMERYSVMFSNVMDRDQKPSLLARRCKTLDNLHIPSTQEFLSVKAPPVSHRQATSPARSSCTAFPTSQPPKAAQILGTQSWAHGPSPRLRSSTLPSEHHSTSMDSRLFHDNTSCSTLESPIFSNRFSGHSNTPRSSNTYPRKEEKPLPAIKPEPATSQTHTLSSQAPTSKYRQQKHRTSQAKESKESCPKRRARPNLTIQTQNQAPAPPAKDKPSSRSIVNSISSDIPRTTSPTPLESDMKSNTLEKATIPIITEREVPDVKDKSPPIEVSTARSISVSRGKRQMLVPIGSRVDHFSSDERFVDRQALVPLVMDAHGHRHVVSQELRIESL